MISSGLVSATMRSKSVSAKAGTAAWPMDSSLELAYAMRVWLVSQRPTMQDVDA